jgi:hypothetical protein
LTRQTYDKIDDKQTVISESMTMWRDERRARRRALARDPRGACKHNKSDHTPTQQQQ